MILGCIRQENPSCEPLSKRKNEKKKYNIEKKAKSLELVSSGQGALHLFNKTGFTAFALLGFLSFFLIFCVFLCSLFYQATLLLFWQEK
jgi:hypothetical protein